MRPIDSPCATGAISPPSLPPDYIALDGAIVEKGVRFGRRLRIALKSVKLGAELGRVEDERVGYRLVTRMMFGRYSVFAIYISRILRLAKFDLWR